MESDVSKFTGRPENVAWLFNRTLYGMLAVTMSGSVCHAIFCYDKLICFDLHVLVNWVLVAGYALCQLCYCCRPLPGIHSESRKRFSETEMRLYHDAVSRERLI